MKQAILAMESLFNEEEQKLNIIQYSKMEGPIMVRTKLRIHLNYLPTSLTGSKKAPGRPVFKVTQENLIKEVVEDSNSDQADQFYTWGSKSLNVLGVRTG